jgi:branched-chain amino acid transport system permease protein
MTPVLKDRRLLGAVAIIGAAALVPTVLHDTFWLRVLTEALMWIGLALGFDVLAGYTGYLNFGHQAFFGIGAYATALLMMRAHWPFFLALPCGGLAGAAAALLVGIPTLRLRGAYFAIATWAVARAVQQYALVAAFTGGADGLRTTPYLNPQFFYYVMLGVVGATFLVLWVLLERAPFGLKLKAVREDQESAKALGLNPTRLKIQAFVLSAVPAALCGGVFAWWVTFIDPDSTLGDLLSDQALVMVVFGGMGTLVGPVIGAVVIFAFKTLFWAYLSAYEVLYLIILGAVIAGSVVFLPDGLLGMAFRRRSRNQAGPAVPDPSASASEPAVPGSAPALDAAPVRGKEA